MRDRSHPPSLLRRLSLHQVSCFHQKVWVGTRAMLAEPAVAVVANCYGYDLLEADAEA